MAKPASRQQFIDYCLRALGSPILEINIDDDQLEDRIDESIQWYQSFHSDSVVRNFYKHQITQEDHDRQPRPYIELPEELMHVLRVLPIGVANGTQGIFSVDYQLHLNDLYDLRRPGNLINYEMTRQYLSLINMTLNGMDQGIIFSRHQNTLEIACDWSMRIPVGSWVIIECYQTINPEQYTDVYNDLYLKRYATALIKRNWAQNLSKFKDMTLPGGVKIDGATMMTEAKEELKELEAEVRSVWETPCDFYVG